MTIEVTIDYSLLGTGIIFAVGALTTIAIEGIVFWLRKN